MPSSPADATIYYASLGGVSFTAACRDSHLGALCAPAPRPRPAPLQAAHIGVGISGREGRAAVLAADFSFAQFRFVSRLVLMHGRMACKRNCGAPRPALAAKCPEPSCRNSMLTLGWAGDASAPEHSSAPADCTPPPTHLPASCVQRWCSTRSTRTGRGTSRTSASRSSQVAGPGWGPAEGVSPPA